MGGDGDGSEVETHQNFDDSDVFTRDKRVSVGIETIRVFFTGRLPSESFMMDQRSLLPINKSIASERA